MRDVVRSVAAVRDNVLLPMLAESFGSAADWKSLGAAVSAFEEKRTRALDELLAKYDLARGDYEALAAELAKTGRYKIKKGESARHFCERHLRGTNISWRGSRLPCEAFNPPGRPQKGMTASEVKAIDYQRATNLSARKACYVETKTWDNAVFQTYLRRKKKRAV